MSSECDNWTMRTKELLEELDRRIAEIQADAEKQVAFLLQRKRALEGALIAYCDAIAAGPPEEAGLAKVKQDYTEALDPQEIADMSQRAILKLIASKNNNVLLVARAAKLMKAAGVFGNPEHADAGIYSVVMRRPEFVKIDKGVYRVDETRVRAPKPTTHRDRTDSGLQP